MSLLDFIRSQFQHVHPFPDQRRDKKQPQPLKKVEAGFMHIIYCNYYCSR